MVAYKGPDMLLEAAAPLLRDGRMTLEMIGDGPLLNDLKAQAAKSGISQAVQFHGWVAHDAVQDIMTNCAMLAFPSIREFGGGVVLEAMALGITPLIVDYAGPGELVKDGMGYKVPLGSRAKIIADFRQQLTQIAATPEQLPKLGKAARLHILQHLTWDKKALQMVQVYNWVLGIQDEKPEFF